MYDLRFYYKPEEITEAPKIKIINLDFKEIMSKDDKKNVEKIWKDLKSRAGSKVYSTPNGLGNLHSAVNGTLTYGLTEFKENIAAIISFEKHLLSHDFYEKMRASVVGCSLELSDGSIVVQRRAADISIYPNLIDSSVAGYVHITDGKLNFELAVLEKLNRELGLESREITRLRATGVHTSEKEFSGTIDFAAKTSLSKEEIKKRYNKKFISEIFFVNKENLPDFIVKHFSIEQDMFGEGCASLMYALNKEDFLEVLRRIRKNGKIIQFGKLIDGKFVEEK